MRILADDAKVRQPTVVKLPDEVDDLIDSVRTQVPMHALILDKETKGRIERIKTEFMQRGRLQRHGLAHRRKVLLTGPPGTGKTMTAKVLASELKLPLHVVQVDRLITRYMGESSAKLRQVFDRMQKILGVYLFDEFDAIGATRDQTNDVGEMRRVVTSFLQFIGNDPSDNIVLAATNNMRILDKAMFRRFDDVLFYALPTELEREKLIKNTLGTFMGPEFAYGRVVSMTDGLSHAEIKRALQDSMKSAVLNDRPHVTPTDVMKYIRERQVIYERGKE